MEVQLDSPDAVEAFRVYKELTNMVTRDSSLSDKDFNRVLDNYLWGTGSMTADEYANLSPGQEQIIQCIKRSRERNKKL
jgi:hypothetical protein